MGTSKRLPVEEVSTLSLMDILLRFLHFLVYRSVFFTNTEDFLIFVLFICVL
jgi:hypothetical protein